MNTSSPPHALSQDRETWGLWLGVLGVALFALTLPMTRLATGTTDAPQLSPWFITFARIVIAGSLSVVFLVATRSPWPPAATRPYLLGSVLGNALGFPLFLAWALRSVTSGHAAVITALLPLATAAIAALWGGHRAKRAFWAWALAGTGLVVLFAVQRAGGLSQVWSQGSWADLCLLAAVVSAGLGYVCGAHVTPVLGAERVICWVCAAALPLALPLAGLTWPESAATIAPSAWMGLAYVGSISMWAGFFAWYRGLAWGGTLRVSQVQSLQPFIALLSAVPLLGEPLEPMTLAFALAVVGTVWMGRRA